MSHFQPYGQGRPCMACEHYGGWDSSGTHVVCVRGPGISVVTCAATGCAFWMRATGADDDLEDRKGQDFSRYQRRAG